MAAMNIPRCPHELSWLPRFAVRNKRSNHQYHSFFVIPWFVGFIYRRWPWLQPLYKLCDNWLLTMVMRVITHLAGSITGPWFHPNRNPSCTSKYQVAVAAMQSEPCCLLIFMLYPAGWYSPNHFLVWSWKSLWLTVGVTMINTSFWGICVTTIKKKVTIY